MGEFEAPQVAVVLVGEESGHWKAAALMYEIWFKLAALAPGPRPHLPLMRAFLLSKPGV